MKETDVGLVDIITRASLWPVVALAVSFAAGVSLFLSTPVAAECDPARQAPARALSEIAIVSADQYGFVIFYEPDLVSKIGPLLSTFFLEHESAHVCLGHVQYDMFTVDPYSRSWLREAYELQADCLAARILQAQRKGKAVQVAIEYFSGDSPIRFVPGHRSDVRRATSIRECATQ